MDPTSAPLTSVADFLLDLFKMGLQVATDCNYRLAIAVVHQGFHDVSSVSNSEPIKHLLWGMFIQEAS